MKRALQFLSVAGTFLLIVAPAFAQNNVTVKGRIIRMQSPDQFVIRTSDNKELIFHATPETRYVISGKAGRFADLRVETDVTAVYTVRDNRYMVSSVTVGVAAAPEPAPQPAPLPEPKAQVQPPAEGTMVQGTVVRVLGQDQVVIRTQDNKEVIVYVVPQTQYIFNEKPGRFADINAGADIRIMYEVRDDRNIARRILGLPPRRR